MNATATATETPLMRMAHTTPTDWWNDSSAIDELEYAIANGAVGATSNPPIVLEVLRAERERWRRRARELFAAAPRASEAWIAWTIVAEIAQRGAALLLPIFEATGGAKGRLSIQTDPGLYRDAAAMLDQAREFAALAPNMQVKLPVTVAGLRAIEDATCRGISVNATVNTTLAGAIAVADAVERGLARRAAGGDSADDVHSVCTVMVGRLDDWLKVVADREGLTLTPGAADWAGVAVFKRAYALFRERGYRTRLLAAAFRNHLHWSQLIGGNVILTMTHAWQVRFNASSLEVRSRIDDAVDERIVDELRRLLPDFHRAYEPDGLAIGELDGYGATVRTLRQFIGASAELEAVVRDFVLPDPDRPEALP